MGRGIFQGVPPEFVPVAGADAPPRTRSAETLVLLELSQLEDLLLRVAEGHEGRADPAGGVPSVAAAEFHPGDDRAAAHAIVGVVDQRESRLPPR
jgi:hypothetical protein